MPFIQQAIAEAAEGEVVPEGEYDLRVIGAEQMEKDGKESIIVNIAIETTVVKNPQPMRAFFGLPGKDDDENKRNFKTLMMARFLAAFRIPHEDNGYDTDDFAGATATLPVKQRQVEPEGKEAYTVNDVVLPRLSDERSANKEADGKPGMKRRRA